MIEELISVSKDNLFSELYLDTEWSLYKNFRFKETSPYPECIAPKELWEKMIFMMKEL